MSKFLSYTAVLILALAPAAKADNIVDEFANEIVKIFMPAFLVPTAKLKPLPKPKAKPADYKQTLKELREQELAEEKRDRETRCSELEIEGVNCISRWGAEIDEMIAESRKLQGELVTCPAKEPVCYEGELTRKQKVMNLLQLRMAIGRKAADRKAIVADRPYSVDETSYQKYDAEFRQFMYDNEDYLTGREVE